MREEVDVVTHGLCRAYCTCKITSCTKAKLSLPSAWLLAPQAALAGTTLDSSMSSMNVESYALAGDIALELSPVASDEPSRIVSHSSPKHHRSSCLFDDSKCHTSNISSSTDGAKPSSQAGDSVQGAAAERIQLQMPDFASMLPSECNFLESSADDATAPTPHTPVVLNVFEGEGLQVGFVCLYNTHQATCNTSTAIDICS